MPVLTLQVSAGANDGHVNSTTLSATNTNVIFGNYTANSYSGFFRLTGVDIPQGNSITEAHFEGMAVTTTSGGGNVRIYANDVDNATAPTTKAEYDGKEVTAAYVDWTTPAQTAGAWFNSPDIKSVIQEIVNRAGWASGNAIMLLVKDNGSGAEAYGRVKSYESSGNVSGLKLVITHSTVAPDTVISTAAIAGVTAPVTGATPVSTIADTSEYTATIAWSGNPSTFAPGTAYTATITLTPKAGYTLTGVSANFFTVAGATATNSANSGVVSAVFPATAALTAAEVAAGITSIIAPAKDATTLTLPSVTAGYTVAIYSSNNTGVIALNGTVTPPTADTTVALVLTVTRTSDSTTANTGSMNVAVPARSPIAVISVGLNQSTITLPIGSTFQLAATVNPANADNKAVTWSSNSSGVATVNSSGLVTAISAGTATITVTTADGGKTAACVITVPSTGKLRAQALLFGVSTTAFDAAYLALNTYLNTTLAVFANMTAATTGLVRATWDTKWKDYYNARTDLLNAIAAKAKALADTAQTAVDALAGNLGDMAYQDVVELAKLGTTIIEGGYLKTVLLLADLIRGGTLTVGGAVGSATYNGSIEVKDVSDNVIISIDKNGQIVNVPAISSGASAKTIPFAMHSELKDVDIIRFDDYQINNGADDNRTEARIEVATALNNGLGHELKSVLYISAAGFATLSFVDGVYSSQFPLYINDDQIITGTPGVDGNLGMFNADGDIVDGLLAASAAPICVDRKDDTVDNTASNSLIKRGWGYVTHTAATFNDKAILFPNGAFDDANVDISLTFLGVKNTAGAPANRAAGVATYQQAVTEVVPGSITASGFTARIKRTDSVNFTAGHFSLFSWIAIGTKAR